MLSGSIAFLIVHMTLSASPCSVRRKALLRELAAFNRELCVITTRIPVADIANHEAPRFCAATWNSYRAMPARSCSERSASKGTKVSCEVPATGGSIVWLPYFLAIEGAALYFADRTSEQIPFKRKKTWMGFNQGDWDDLSDDPILVTET
jgi:hypothetical protein